MLGFEVAQSTVSKYMVQSKTPPSQSWKCLSSLGGGPQLVRRRFEETHTRFYASV
jgi:hypothetical protein